jgi:small glutamine-rich tetratricopeptide repeat-containing protein alpha
MSAERHNSLLRAISEYLAFAGKDCGADADDVETIRDTLHATFKLDQGSNVLPAGTSLVDVFEKGLESLGVSVAGSNPWADSKPAADPLEDDPVFKKFLQNVTKKGYFKGCEEGTDAYRERFNKVLGKFKSRMDSQKEDTERLEKEADEKKKAGNACLGMGDYESACTNYKKAIEICPNGKSSHVYHSNLAAALSHLGKHEMAAQSCVSAISLNPNYAKAYSRLGYARTEMKDYPAAKDAYEKAVALDPSSKQAKSALASVMQKLPKSSATVNTPTPAASAPQGPPAGMPDLSGLAAMMGGAGGAGGMPDLAGMMNNPMMMQAAQSMMQNPQMMQMAQNMMQDPAAMQRMMGMMGGGGGGAPGGAGMPDLSSLAGMMGNMGAGNGSAESSPDGPEFQNAD